VRLLWCGPAAAALLLSTAVQAPAGERNAPDSFQVTTLTRSSAPADETLWAAIKDTGYRELLKLYLERYPDSPNARHARDAIAVLDGAPTKVEKAVLKAARVARRNPSPVAAIFAVAIEEDAKIDVAQLQRDLVTHGCNAGAADGIWGSRSAGAAGRFVRAAGRDIDTSTPNNALVEAVAAATGDVCGDYVRRAPAVVTESVPRQPVFRNIYRLNR